MQRARNRRPPTSVSTSTDVRICLMRFLMPARPEALFLIHHQQTEIGEITSFESRPVRADQNVDLTTATRPNISLTA